MSIKVIDEIDAIILKGLLQNGRRKLSMIAEEAYLSEDLVCQHYKKMEKKGIIVGATTMIDYSAFGLNLNTSVSITVPKQEQQIVIEQLSKIPGLYNVYRWGSSSNLWAVLHLANTQKMDELKQLIRKIPSVTKVEFEIWTGIRYSFTNLSILSNKDSSTDTTIRAAGEDKVKRDLIELDKIDRQIIEELVFQGRAHFWDIAEKIGTSTCTVMRRYQKLLHQNIIMPIIQINPSKIGYPVNAIFRLIANSQNDLDNIADAIFKIPDVYSIIKTVGIYDFTLFTCVKNIEHLLNLEYQIENLSSIQLVERAAVLSLSLSCLPFPGIPLPYF